MTHTLADIYEEVRMNLQGAIYDSHEWTVLMEDITDSDTSFVVEDATKISTGLIQIRDELAWCTEIDPESNTIYVKRGSFGTGGKAHGLGNSVENDPRYPRVQVWRMVNHVIRSLYPDIYTVASTNITTTTAITTYALPAVATSVLDVTYDELSPSGHWSPIKRWAMDSMADPTEYPTGKTITIFDPVLSGRSVRVTYTAEPLAFDLTVDYNLNLFSSTGLPESTLETVVYGVCARLAGYNEVPRLTDDSAEASFMGTQQPGSMLTASRWFYQMFLQAKAEEVRRLQALYPPRIHFLR